MYIQITDLQRRLISQALVTLGAEHTDEIKPEDQPYVMSMIGFFGTVDYLERDHPGAIHLCLEPKEKDRG